MALYREFLSRKIGRSAIVMAQPRPPVVRAYVFSLSDRVSRVAGSVGVA